MKQKLNFFFFFFKWNRAQVKSEEPWKHKNWMTYLGESKSSQLITLDFFSKWKKIDEKHCKNVRCKGKKWKMDYINTDTRFGQKLHCQNWFSCYKIQHLYYSLDSGLNWRPGERKELLTEFYVQSVVASVLGRGSRNITILDAVHMLYSGRNAEKSDSQNKICICWVQLIDRDGSCTCPTRLAVFVVSLKEFCLRAVGRLKNKLEEIQA